MKKKQYRINYFIEPVTGVVRWIVQERAGWFDWVTVVWALDSKEKAKELVKQYESLLTNPSK